MSDNFIGEIRMFGGNFAPFGWHMCDGSLLPISQYQALFALVGTTYGGDGVQTFGLPDLRGRVPVHQGTGRTGTPYVIGQPAGAENVTLTTAEIPSHNHSLTVSSAAAGTNNPSNAYLGVTTVPAYGPGLPVATMAASAVGRSGSSLPHDNMMPFQCVTYIIALNGIFPTRN